MAEPDFNHIHCSSRYDRAADVLDEDIDTWRQSSSIITLTDAANDGRGARLQDVGWGYHAARRAQGKDDAAIAWRRATWGNPWNAVRKLTFQRTGEDVVIHVASALLKHKDTGRRLMVSVASMPTAGDIPGLPENISADEVWRIRKRAYTYYNGLWSRWVETTRVEQKAHGIIVVGDWNADLKADWLRDFLTQHWGEKFKLTWKNFPTYGSAVNSDKILDGTLAKHAATLDGGAKLLDKVQSSDHRPYREHLQINEGEIPDDPTIGGYEGEEWWGFGDYRDDEIYQLETVTGGAGGEEL